LTTNLGDVQNDAYVQSLKSSPAAKQIGDLNDSNTLLTLNSPDVKRKIADSSRESISELPLSKEVKEAKLKEFADLQDGYSDTVTHAFARSLRTLFTISAITMGLAAIFVFTLKERELGRATAQATPGEA
jgi:hypothetical protein